jgi:protein-tyrosine phosphatase
MIKILTVCLGNICRSPAAEGILRSELTKVGAIEGQDFIIDSAGTGDWHIGHPPDERSQKVCQKYEIDISAQKARQITVDDGDAYDFILGMDHSNIDNLKKVIGEPSRAEVALFDAVEVNDPYFSASDGFEIMYQQLERAAQVWVKRWGW